MRDAGLVGKGDIIRVMSGGWVGRCEYRTVFLFFLSGGKGRGRGRGREGGWLRWGGVFWVEGEGGRKEVKRSASMIDFL